MKKPVPEFIDPDFAKTSPKRSVSVIQNGRFGLAFAKTGSIISATDVENLLSDSLQFGYLLTKEFKTHFSILAICIYDKTTN